MKIKNLGLLSLSLLLISSCNNENQYLYWKPVKEFSEVEAELTSSKEIAKKAGEGSFLVQDCMAEFRNDFLVIEFLNDTAELIFTPQAAGLPESWKDFSELLIEVGKEKNYSLQLKLSYTGIKNIISDNFDIKKNNQIIIFSLHEIPLAGNNERTYHPEYINLKLSGELENELLRIKSIKLRKEKREEQGPVVDKFGQSMNGNWEGKVRNTVDLQEDLSGEKKRISKNPNPEPDRDQYGGLIVENKYPSSGYFNLAKDESGKHFFITPEGNPFWSLGVTCVRPKLQGTDGTNVSNREFLFEFVPDRKGEYAEAWSDSLEMSYYYLNILRKYGNLDNWISMIYERLPNWGLNTIGNWSNEKVIAGSEIPFTYSFRTTRNEKYSLGSGLNDVFDPGWEAYVDSVISKASEFRNNPFLLGYFVDNEAGWGNSGLLERLKQASPGRDEWLKLIKEKYASLDELNEKWYTSYEGWEAVKNMTAEIDNKDFSDVYTDFEKRYADKYFSTVKNSLKKYDPNHLYLGCRFTRRLKPDHILESAGEYCDVITVNVYSLVPIEAQMTAWHQKTGKPILIGEHHLPLATNKQFAPRYRAFTQNERFRFYKDYVRTWADMPFSLGCHWYQLVDQHVTGRPTNGENQVIGLVDITDQPYDHMVKAISQASDSIYIWHLK
ncbi:MAG: beta-galactosidase [bacterium]